MPPNDSLQFDEVRFRAMQPEVTRHYAIRRHCHGQMSTYRVFAEIIASLQTVPICNTSA